MTVSQLIGVLRGYPADMRAVVNGHEEGYDDLSPGRSPSCASRWIPVYADVQALVEPLIKLGRKQVDDTSG